MAFCAYADNDPMRGSTTLANIFLTEYMPEAAGDYVKVYLYGLLMCRYGELCDGFEQMAEALHMDAGTVKNAFAYWEREGIVTKLTDNPPSYGFVTLTSEQKMSDTLDDEVYTNRDYIRTLQTMMPSLAIENHEIRQANDWLEVFQLEPEAVYLLVKTEAEKRKNKLPSARTMFKHLNDEVKKWAEAGVHSAQEAQNYLRRENENYKISMAVIDRFNQRRQPTEDELMLADRWINEMHFTQEEILAAMHEMTKAERPSFKYLDSILQNKRLKPDDGLRDKVKKLNAHLGISSVPTQEQEKTLQDFLDLGFEFPAIEQAAIQCGMNNRRRYEDIAKKLAQWKAAGVFTVEDIEKERELRKRDSELVSKIFENAGIERRISDADIKSARIWRALVDEDALLYAASQAHGTENPIRYIDKIIKSWSLRGVTTLEKAKLETAPPKPAAAQSKANPSKILDEREVRDEDYGDWFNVTLKHEQSTGA